MKKMKIFFIAVSFFSAVILGNSDLVLGQDISPAWLGNVYHILFENIDCNGDKDGTAYLDNCNNCVGGNTGISACTRDCNGDWGGTAIITTCGCVAGNTGVDENVACVANPSTNRFWMEKNLGASRVAESLTDTLAYGDLYQWGRLTDGHEKRNSGTTDLLSTTDVPVDGNFIITSSPPYDWRVPQNNYLWQGVNGINNPCPAGFRLPTVSEWQAEIATWIPQSATGGFDSALKLPLGGYRSVTTGAIYNDGGAFRYWTSTADFAGNAFIVYTLSDMSIQIGIIGRAAGGSVRCIRK